MTITYPAKGRGAWPSSGAGGTVSSDGTRPGRFFRTPVSMASAPKKIGLVGFRAERDGTDCSVDDWAVFRAVQGLQKFFGTEPDGIWGPKTDAQVKAWQQGNGLKADGVVGPATAKKVFLPLCTRYADTVDGDHPELGQMVAGHINYESAWDPAAVGVLSPQDVGLGQINGPAHPEISLDDRLDPHKSIPWVCLFVDSNLKAMSYDVRDAVLAYNTGQGGARSWIRDGRPDVWNRNGKPPLYAKRYIDAVLNF